MQRAAGGNALCLRAHQPVQQIHVVAGLLHDAGTGQLRPAPVAAHKAVRKMEIPDIFVQPDRHKAADAPGIENLLDSGEKRRVAQDVADYHMQLSLLGKAQDVHAFSGVGGNGLFQKNMVAQLQRLHHLRVMIPVHRSDNCRVRNFSLGPQRLDG